MKTFARGQANFDRATIARGGQAPAERLLALYPHDPVTGRPLDPDSITFEVWNVVNPQAPSKVYPTSGSKTVNLDNVPTGDRLCRGVYLADFSVPVDASAGAHEVRWTFAVAGAASQTATTAFTVGAASSAGETFKALGTGLYCELQDLRDEGFASTRFPDALVTKRIQQASANLERLTGRFFEPRVGVRHLNGTGHDTLFLDEPIIELAELRFLPVPGTEPKDDGPVGPDECLVYNRHIAQGLLSPDDRMNPRITLGRRPDEEEGGDGWLAAPSVFPRGHQNVQVVGVWGYTERDVSNSGEAFARFGRVPTTVRDVCVRMVAKTLPLLADVDDRAAYEDRHRLASVKLGESSTTWTQRKEGRLTGDPDLDRMIASLRRPLAVGAA